jgi:nucleoside-diphosphate-sugar epimerase
MTPSNRLFCFGLGYSALALADLLRPRGWTVAGTCRTEDKRAALAERGIEAFLFDRGRKLADPPRALAGTTHLLSSVPPDATGDPVIDQHGADLRQLRGVAWTGYLSTTGVYGDRQGAWVDETSDLTPSGTRGQRRLDAERAWLALDPPAHLFRLAGIYGPGRSAIDTVRQGRARRIDKPGQVFSRIHVDDIATVLLASIIGPNPGAAYNVCDDDPAAPAIVIEEACRLLGVEPPPIEAFDRAKATMSAMAISFYDDNKRVRNDRIKRELGVTLKYPTYREGLRAVLAAT